MPHSGETRAQSTGTDAILRAFQSELSQKIEDILTAAMKEQGFPAALKLSKKVERPTHNMMSVQDGVIEKLPSGGYDAALQTDQGPVTLLGAKRTDHESTDLQLTPSRSSKPFDTTSDSGEFIAEQVLRQLTDAGASPSCDLLCKVELTSFDPSQRQVLLPLLWHYILDHRNSNDREELVAVGAAIRKYIAIMPMEQMGELAVLLESGHRSPLPIDLEIEVTKMIYRNLEVHPPVVADPHPELAQQLWAMVQAYINPRILLRDKHAAATSLAIEAIVSMRSPLAEQAWQAAMACPYRWFAELVSDDLDDLCDKWSCNSPDAAAWLRELRNKVLAHA